MNKTDAFLMQFKAFLSTLLFIPLLFSAQILMGQSAYWIGLTDKGNTEDYQLTDILSARAIQNRLKQGFDITESDFPLASAYLQQLQQMGIDIRHQSKWINAVSANLTAEEISRIEQLPFVRKVWPVASGGRVTEVLAVCPEPEAMDTYLPQLQMVGLDKLHQAGYSGEGVLIAVFDNGFLGVDTINGFEHLFRENRIYAARDFVDGDDNVYESCNHCRHGTNVLSILAAKMPGYLIGTAPDASYLLLRTEDDSRENPQEEDNWLAAAEYADSLGAQVFTTSLGYFDFDGEENDYQLSDLDGNTATITRAGDIAASKGIIVVNSAGNSGTRGINAPADGDSILAIAAVDQCQDLAPFSSRGPSFDGRIKPELAAMGSGNTLLRHDGSLARGSGTSFSCPIISGLTACLLQAAPNASNLEMYDALFQSASQFDAPDFDIGYGIPDGAEALRILAGSEAIQKGPTDFPLSILYPNPNQGAFDLIFQPNALPARIEVDIIDLQGRSVFQDVFSLSAIRPQIHIETALQAGLYHINLQEMESGQRLEGKKLWIR